MTDNDNFSWRSLTTDGPNADECGAQCAVIYNGPEVAAQLGYYEPSKTQIATLKVILADGTVLFEDEVGDGKYLSAIWVEGWLAYRNLGLADRVEFDLYAKSCLMKYMGVKVCRDARNEDLQNHPFVRALLNADTEQVIYIGVIWK